MNRSHCPKVFKSYLQDIEVHTVPTYQENYLKLLEVLFYNCQSFLELSAALSEPYREFKSFKHTLAHISNIVEYWRAV